jgi:hypothetical protein
MRSGRIPVAVALAMVLTSAACGSSSSGGGGSATSPSSPPSAPTVSAAAYVHAVCTTLNSTVTSVRSATNDYTKAARQAAQSGDLAKVKSTTVSFLDQVGSLLTQASTGLANAGVPPVTNGAGVRSQLVDGFDAMAREVKAISGEIGATSTSDPTSLATELQGMGTQLQAVSKAFGQSLNKLASPSEKTLDKAARNDPVCKNFHSS